MLAKKGLKVKLYLTFILAVLLPLLTIVYLLFDYSSGTLKKFTLKEASEDLKIRSIQIEKFFSSSVQEIDFIANLSSGVLDEQNANSSRDMNQHQWTEQFSSIGLSMMHAKPHYHEISFFGADGRELSRLSRRKNLTPFRVDASALKIGQDKRYVSSLDLSLDETHFSAPTLFRRGKKILKPYLPVVNISRKIVDESSNVRGVVVFKVNLQPILSLIPREIETGQQYNIIDHNGYFIKSFDEKMDWGSVINDRQKYNLGSVYGGLEENFLNRDHSSFRSESFKSEVVTLKVWPDPNDREFFWNLFTTIPEEYFVTEASGNRGIIIFGILIFCLLVTFVVYSLINSITNPIQKISNTLDSVSNKSSTTSKNLTVSAEEVSASTSEQASAIQESVSAMSELTSMVAQTAEQATSSREASNLVLEMTREGRQTMKNVVELMVRVDSAMNHIQEATNQTENATNQQLDSILNIIDEISSKTNIIHEIVRKTQMLSFNASIEAARAGQHGKGFAVVAQEVGNLAQMSGQAAEAIVDLIAVSKNRVKAIVHETKQGTKNSKEIVEKGSQVSIEAQEVTKNAHSIFELIAKEIKKISEKVSSVRQATDEQKNGLDQISQSMSQMDESTQNTSSEADKNLRIADEIHKISNQLDKMKHAMNIVVLGERKSLSQRQNQAKNSSEIDQLIAEVNREGNGAKNSFESTELDRDTSSFTKESLNSSVDTIMNKLMNKVGKGGQKNSSKIKNDDDSIDKSA